MVYYVVFPMNFLTTKGQNHSFLYFLKYNFAFRESRKEIKQTQIVKILLLTINRLYRHKTA